MNKIAIAALGAAFLLAGRMATADEVTPAWQAPGYVMEEVVVTAPAQSTELAWQQPGFVMEEVVATASRSDIVAALEERPMLRRRGAYARHLHHELMHELGVDAPAANGG